MKIVPSTTFYHTANRTAASRLQIWRRGITSRHGVDKQMVEKLPLAGIKVLDMTRVLAGVGNSYSEA